MIENLISTSSTTISTDVCGDQMEVDEGQSIPKVIDVWDCTSPKKTKKVQ